VPAPHPPQFRRRAVELAREKTKPVAELAKDLRISESCLRNWVDLSFVSIRDRFVRTPGAKLERAVPALTPTPEMGQVL
jgi:transposase-like protein